MAPRSRQSGTPTAEHCRRSGRTQAFDGPDPRYNARHHPADVVLRPAQARKVLGISSRQCDASRVESEDESEDNMSQLGSTDEESEPEDMQHEAKKLKRPLLSTFAPDPQAVRRSTRAEAQKPVLYNSKVHPMDVRFRAGLKRERQHGQTEAPPNKRSKAVALSASSAELPLVGRCNQAAQDCHDEDENGQDEDADKHVSQEHRTDPKEDAEDGDQQELQRTVPDLDVPERSEHDSPAYSHFRMLADRLTQQDDKPSDFHVNSSSVQQSSPSYRKHPMSLPRNPVRLDDFLEIDDEAFYSGTDSEEERAEEDAQLTVISSQVSQSNAIVLITRSAAL